MSPEWFAGRLRELRHQAGLSREQLAELAGMKKSGIVALEQGRRQPALETLVALCQALDVPCSVLLAEPTTQPGGDDEPPRPPAKTPAAKQPKRKGKK
jgi:transcriptional regulator with XRE-family HTH domain